jgi:hypothetical protein
MTRPPAPGPHSTKDPATREDLRRLRIYLEKLGQDMDALQARIDELEADGGGSGTSLTSTAPVDVTKAAAAVGVGTSAARHDHKHNISTAAAGTIQPDDTAAEGTATSLARSDHRHAIVAATAGAATPGDTAAEGSATSFARSDHRHSLPAFGTTAGTFAQGNDSRFDFADPYFFFHKAPASAHADSDEFTEGTLNARWSIVKHSALTTPITASGTVTESGTGSVTQPLITPNYRGSWFAYQGQDGGIIRQFARPATLQVRVRMAVPVTYQTGSPVGLLYVGAAGGGTPDTANNIVRVGYSGGTYSALGQSTSLVMVPVIRSSGGVQDGPTMNTLAGHSRNIEFIILLTGTGGSMKARVYVRNGLELDQVGEGSPASMGSGDNIYIYLRFSNQWNNKGGSNVNAIGLCDYIRIRTDDMLEDYA